MTSKPFPPSAKKMRQARREGKVLRSQLLSQTIGTIFSMIAVGYAITSGWLHDRMLLHYLWTEGFADPLAAGGALVRRAGELIFLALGFAAAGGVGAELVQVGIKFEWSVVGIHADRVNPGTFGERLLRGGTRAGELVLKLGFLSVFSLWFCVSYGSVAVECLAANSLEPVVRALRTAGGLSLGVLIVFGGVDYALRRREYMKDLSMTHEEVRRESREEDGDPLQRTVRRGLHEQVLEGEIVQRLRRSKVVIVEPRQRARRAVE